jgi:hypothetical protein
MDFFPEFLAVGTELSLHDFRVANEKVNVFCGCAVRHHHFAFDVEIGTAKLPQDNTPALTKQEQGQDRYLKPINFVHGVSLAISWLRLVAQAISNNISPDPAHFPIRLTTNHVAVIEAVHLRNIGKSSWGSTLET